ncbi:MAG: hypothetical protein J7J93_00940 [Candidatus Aenigmarchaeota archaeon]|nr:hypothetical protein [Candidatus Aenigmarchaeota archaeon]
MAGYIMNLDNLESLKTYIYNGVYSTKISPPSKDKWRKEQEATFADYVTMKPGDNIYFFIKRKIYGIGELVAINNDCKFLNYPDANKPRKYDYNELKNDLLWDEGEYSVNQRWVCIFKPNPYFFKKGIDMDDFLSSNPSKFRMLRAFWKVSFIKIDDEENQAFKDVLLRNNQETLATPNKEDIFPSNYSRYHSKIKEKINQNINNYNFKIKDILLFCSKGSEIKHEMALEVAILFQLTNKHENTVNIFGNWDYLSHQVIASPFKPIDYMDKMDIFGYSFISGHFPTISKFLVIEIKKDTANEENIEQLLKYVDWVKEEYSYGDYSMINAYLVAHDFNEDVINYAKKVGVRKYTIGKRPAKSREWSNLKLVKYLFDSEDCSIKFELIK